MQLVARVRQMRPELDVRLGFLEFSEPNIVDVLGELVADEVRDVVAVPLLLADAYHARIDLPTLLADHAPTGLHVTQASVLGADERLLRLVRQRVRETGVEHPGVILTAVGSSDVTANARTRALAAQWPISTTVFATGESATVAEAADCLRARGVTKIVVAPWFLSPGLLLDRVGAQARQAGAAMAAPLGPDPLVAAVVLDRYESAIAGTLRRRLAGTDSQTVVAQQKLS